MELTRGLTYKDQASVKLEKKKVAKPKKEKEPEEVFIDQKAYNKIVKKYTDKKGTFSYDLLNKVYEFKSVVEMSARKKEPHLITNYLYDLASSFHTFYAHEKVLTDDSEYTKERINLIKSVAITIKNACYLIGVDAPDRM